MAIPAKPRTATWHAGGVATCAPALLGVSLDAILAHELPPERSKALQAQLIEEVRAVSPTAYRARFAYRMEWWR